MVTPEHLATFRRDGYMVLPGFLSHDEVQALVEELENLTRRLEGRMPSNVSVAWEKNVVDGVRVAHQVLNVHLLSSGVHDIVRSQRLRSLGQALLSEDLALAHSKFILKEKRKGTEIPWHQDMPYWLGEYSAGFLTCMLYLNDADSHNGCLEVVPGSHTGGLRQFENSEETTFGLRSPAVAKSEAISIEASAGTAIIFGPFLMHRSGPNHSDRHRRSISIVLSSTWNLHLARLYDSEPVLDKSLFERRKIRRVTGPGSHAGAWAPYYRRRALRQLAKDCVGDSTRPWLDLSDAFCEEDGFAWFSSRKPREVRLIRIQKYPLVHTHRRDAEVHTGEVTEHLAHLAPTNHGTSGAGLVAFDFATTNGLHDALISAKPWLTAGTILFIDRFFAPPRKRGSRSATLERFATENGMRLQYLARADYAVVVKVNAVETRGGVEFSSFDWQVKGAGIVFEREKLSQFAAEGLRASRLAAGARRVLGPALRGVRASVQELRGVVRRA